MNRYIATNAASSGIRLDKKIIKSLSKRSDVPGLVWLLIWLTSLLCTGLAIYFSPSSGWLFFCLFIYGIFLSVPAYSLSHECAHGTAFKRRWLNESLFWISSFIYMEEPNFRRYSHTRHHTYTWIQGKDAQMPFSTPLKFKGWLIEISGIGLLIYEIKHLVLNSSGKFSSSTREFTPVWELTKLKFGARLFLGLYLGLILLIVNGIMWPLYYFFLPRLLGGPVMLLFTLIQHVEMQENQINLLNSTRSFKTTWLGRFLYMNMNNHVEHHLYPMVPFYQLPALSKNLEEQLHAKDPGFFKTNLEVLSVVIRRSLGKSTKAASIRQHASMIN